MRIEMDFKSDWHDILRDTMTNEWGMDLSGVKGDLPIYYFNALQRRIQPRPRTLYVADRFSCPADHLADWVDIQGAVAAGQDLHLYLSKLVDNAESTDALLNDWGVYHLHFCARPKRSGPLLFARITTRAFYLIGVFGHGEWYENEIVETIHRNWPESVSRWRMMGVSGSVLTTEQRRALRRNNLNAFFLTSDGVTYGPLGGGTTASGHNIFSVIEMDKEHDRLEQVEELLREALPQYRSRLEMAGCKPDDIVMARLHLTDSNYCAHFPAQKLLVTIRPRVFC